MSYPAAVVAVAAVLLVCATALAVVSIFLDRPRRPRPDGGGEPVMVPVRTPLSPVVRPGPVAPGGARRQIPLRVFQTSFTRDGAVPLGIARTMGTWQMAVQPGQHLLFDDAACRFMIARYFPERVLAAYDALIPTAFKADLWRYCALFLYGGFYADSKSSWARSGLALGATVPADVDLLVVADMWQTQNLFVRQDLYNAVMGVRPRHPLLGRVIGRVVRAVEERDYGRNPVAITGPGALGEAFAAEYRVARAYNWRGRRMLTNSEGREDVVLMWRLVHGGTFRAIEVRDENNEVAVDLQYRAYRSDQRRISTMAHYRELWRQRRVFATVSR